MKFKFRRMEVPLLVVVILFLGSCLEQGTKTYTHNREGFTDEDDIDTYTHEAGDTVKKIRLQLELEVREGSLAWELEDPNGGIKWSGNASAGEHVDVTRDFVPVAGNWTFRITLTNASGDYQIIWKFIK